VRIAWFSPLPPTPSGIADYSFDLVPLLAQEASVDVVSSVPRRFFGRRSTAPRGVRVVDPHGFEGRTDRYDTVFYHIGNSPSNEFAYRASLARPGVNVLHDLTLHHLIAHLTFEAGDRAGYEAILREEHGEAGARLAALRSRRLTTEYEKFVFPLIGHVARAGTRIVVHSRDAADQVGTFAPGVPVTVIPHHASSPPPQVESVEREEARSRLGLPRDSFLVGQFGFIVPAKQPAALLGGFRRLLDARPDARLLMIGEDQTGGLLARLIAAHGLEERVRATGYVDLARFHLFLKAVDVVVSLRFPAVGESSGAFARALAEGRAIIAGNIGSFAEVPDDAILKVDVDGDQAEAVGGHLIRLAEDEGLLGRMEENARAYAASALDPRRCRDLYLEVAREAADDASAGGGPSGDGSEPVVGGSDRGTRSANGPVAPGPTVSSPPAAVESPSELAHRVRLADIERLAAETLPPEGAGIHMDLLYRLALGRPGEESLLRWVPPQLEAGTETRSHLLRQLVESREFREIELIDRTLADLRRTGKRFTIEPRSGHGPDTTERVVEIPWVLSRWRGERRVLDQGYAYALGVYLSGLLALPIEHLHGVDWADAPVPRMVRTRADLRALPYRDGSFHLAICISTIEHVGRDNARYGVPAPSEEGGDVAAVRELERILVPRGRLLVTVPFGHAEDYGWFVQYDAARWQALVSATSFLVEEQEVFRLTPGGWKPTSDLAAMERVRYQEGGAQAARGVLCAALVRP
jgi:glycosyltransferase involved in cell wall biosynthesis/SAM-dependent methyltransferase